MPYNLLGAGGTANFVQTGIWGSKAIKEARHLFGDAAVAASSEANGHTAVPRPEDIVLSSDAAYLHYTANETIGGLEFDYIPGNDAGELRRPDGREVPLACDMSSSILSSPLDVSRFGVIYAGARRTSARPAGGGHRARRSAGPGRADMPSLFSYRALAEAGR